MKNLYKNILVCFLLIFQILILPSRASGEGSGTEFISDAADGIIAYKVAQSGAEGIQSWLDSELTSGAGTFSEWYVIALNRYMSGLDTASYTAALSAYLENNSAGATARQRCALALLVCGKGGYSSNITDSTVGEQGIMSVVFGLHLINNGAHSEKYSAEDITKMLTGMALDGGGWALYGDTPDIDVTAMTVQALSPYISSDANVKKAVDDALDILSKKQLSNGGYMSYGTENPESCAQTIIALTSVGIDPGADTRFIKNGNTLLDAMLSFRLSDGSFSHTSGGDANDASMAQALCALAALKRYKEGLSPFYLFDISNNPSDDGKDSTVNTDSDNIGEKNIRSSYKAWVCLFVTAAVLILCLIFYIVKKRNLKNFLLIIAAGAVIIIIVLLTDIKSPDEYYNGETALLSDKTGTVTLTIRCDAVVDMSDADYIPRDGVILDTVEIDISKGDTVYDALIRAAREYNIKIDKTGSGSTVYISGINYLYELAFGGMSGWVYYVNGISQPVGCGACRLSDNDCIEWLYTLEPGDDIY